MEDICDVDIDGQRGISNQGVEQERGDADCHQLSPEVLAPAVAALAVASPGPSDGTQSTFQLAGHVIGRSRAAHGNLSVFPQILERLPRHGLSEKDSHRLSVLAHPYAPCPRTFGDEGCVTCSNHDRDAGLE